MERFSRVVEVPQVRFYTAIDLLSGGDDGFGYQKRAKTYKKTTDVALVDGKIYYTKSGDVYTPVTAADLDVDDIGTYYEVDVAGGLDINFMVVERSAVTRSFVAFIDEVYQRMGVFNTLNSSCRMMHADHNAKFYPAICYPQP